MRHTSLLVFALATTACQPDPRDITSAIGDMAVLVESTNDFAFDLYQEESATEGNLFFSPFSIAAALSMVYAGAEGETETQIADVLGVDVTESAWHANMAALFNDLAGDHHRPYELRAANAVWGQENAPFKADFIDVLATSYQAPVEPADFAADPSGERDRINKWVSRQTEGHIEGLFGPADITTMTRVVLANAIYFHGDWDLPFDKDETTDEDFHLLSGSPIQAPMMKQTEDFDVAVYNDLTVLDMPYQGDEVSMTILLPTEEDGVADVEAQLSAEQLATWLAGVEHRSTTVWLPSFELSYDLPLAADLQALGMVDAFDQEYADFTGIMDSTDMEFNYFVQAARHQAWVRVDEEGTEAAAATGFSIGFGSTAENIVPIEFIADHPFVFLIRDRLTGVVLFAGRITDPR